MFKFYNNQILQIGILIIVIIIILKYFPGKKREYISNFKKKHADYKIRGSINDLHQLVPHLLL